MTTFGLIVAALRSVYPGQYFMKPLGKIPTLPTLIDY
jgi:hypothetical protein